MTAKPSSLRERVDKAIDQGIDYLLHHQYIPTVSFAVTSQPMS
ncbi:hypothetical protein [Spirosoma agri]|nr:hypothetical protein [Spirosoma agri]